MDHNTQSAGDGVASGSASQTGPIPAAALEAVREQFAEVAEGLDQVRGLASALRRLGKEDAQNEDAAAEPFTLHSIAACAVERIDRVAGDFNALRHRCCEQPAEASRQARRRLPQASPIAADAKLACIFQNLRDALNTADVLARAASKALPDEESTQEAFDFVQALVNTL
jgi:hypothetical protein